MRIQFYGIIKKKIQIAYKIREYYLKNVFFDSFWWALVSYCWLLQLHSIHYFTLILEDSPRLAFSFLTISYMTKNVLFLRNIITRQTLKGSYDAFFKDHYLVYLVEQNMLTCFNVQKTHYFANTVDYFRSCMPRLSQTLRFLQSPSFQQAQSALIGQLTQCIGRTPQARVGNVTALSIIASFF